MNLLFDAFPRKLLTTAGYVFRPVLVAAWRQGRSLGL